MLLFVVVFFCVHSIKTGENTSKHQGKNNLGISVLLTLVKRAKAKDNDGTIYASLSNCLYVCLYNRRVEVLLLYEEKREQNFLLCFGFLFASLLEF